MEKQDVKEILSKAGKEKLSNTEEAKVMLWLFQLNQQQSPLLSEEQIKRANSDTWKRLASKQLNSRTHRLWPKWVAAACILFVLFPLTLFFLTRQENNTNQISVVDIAPGKNSATLTLGDGTKIPIDDMMEGDIAKQSGVVISKDKEGRIIYKITDTDNTVLTYNTLSTARGQHTKIRLPDGTLVFLNAASSLKFPTNFTKSSSRRVELTGEGYFQVAKNPSYPFIVQTNIQVVKVLGTHFNINTYDPTLTITTLEEGSVNVSNKSSNETLLPGQQAVTSHSTLSIQEADMEQAFAWKEGNFVFIGEDIKSVMSQLERWYDVEAVYEGPAVEGLFYANISRNKSISQVLKVLEKTNGVHFTIQGRRIMVSK